MTLEDTIITMLLDNTNLLVRQAEVLTNSVNEDYSDYFTSLGVIKTLADKLEEIYANDL